MKIPDLLEIARSWIRAINPTEEQQKLAEERLSICNTCPHKEFTPLIMSYSCNACGCPLHKKVYTPKGAEACPTNRWIQ